VVDLDDDGEVVVKAEAPERRASVGIKYFVMFFFGFVWFGL
jgi:hypothetical protein